MFDENMVRMVGTQVLTILQQQVQLQNISAQLEESQKARCAAEDEVKALKAKYEPEVTNG